MAESGIHSIIRFYNFINDKLVKDKLIIKYDKDINTVSFNQDGRLIYLPDFLSDIVIIPEGFKSGYVKKSDLIELYESLHYVASIQGRLPVYLTNSILVPEKFGFSVWSRYASKLPGVQKVGTYKFKVRNKFGFCI